MYNKRVIYGILIIGLLATSINPVIIAIGLFAFFSAYSKSGNDRNLYPFLLLLCLYVFYPQASVSGFHPLLYYQVLIFIMAAACYFFQPVKLSAITRHTSGSHGLIVSWLLLGTFIYLIVVVAYFLGIELNGFYQPPALSIRKYFNTVGVIILAIVPTLFLKDESSFKSFFKYMGFICAVYLIISYVISVTGIRLISYASEFSGSEYEGRFVGFNSSDPLGFGRLLLFPLFLFSAYFLLATRTIRNGLLPFFLFLSIILTLSKTTYGSSLIGILVIIGLWRGLSFKTFAYLFGFSIILFVVLQGFNIISIFANTERGSLGNLEVRLAIQAVAIDIIGSNIWFGAYPGGLFPALEEFGFTYRQMSVHSFYLSTATEWGIVMGSLLLFINGYSGVVHLRNLRLSKKLKIIGETELYTQALSLAGCATATGYFVHGFTEIIPPFMVFLNLGFGLAVRVYLKSYKTTLLRDSIT